VGPDSNAVPRLTLLAAYVAWREPTDDVEGDDETIIFGTSGLELRLGVVAMQAD
jgi:hypothetical protein